MINLEELKEFEKWAVSEGRSIKPANREYSPQVYASAASNNALDGWQARQPEIDALNDEIELKSIALRTQHTAYEKEIERLKAENYRLRNVLPVTPEQVIGLIGSNFNSMEPVDEAEFPEVPNVIMYRSTSIPENEWRSMPIDHWLSKMLENCDYHEAIVIKATLEFIAAVKSKSPFKAEWSADGEPLNLEAAAEDLLGIFSAEWEDLTEVQRLRKFLGES